jgi:hypothetical protein
MAVKLRMEKLWAETRPIGERIAALFEDAMRTGRKRLVSAFQNWIGRFTAT